MSGNLILTLSTTLEHMTMPISALRTPTSALAAGTLTPQQLADFALEADRFRRSAIRAGDLATAVVALRERNALLELAAPQLRRG